MSRKLRDLTRSYQGADRDQAPVPRREIRTQPQVAKQQVSDVLQELWRDRPELLFDTRLAVGLAGFIQREKRRGGGCSLIRPDAALGKDIPRRSNRGSAQPSFDAIIVGGGDGSIGAAASVLAGGDVPLGILPLGTFNYFARDLVLPFELETTVAALAQGHVMTVDVGEVNGRVFINNSSLGIYPHPVAERDRARRSGLARWGSAALAFCRVLWRLPRPRVRVRAPEWEMERRTPCLFIGNYLYRLDAFAIARRSGLQDGGLCLYVANRQSRLGLLHTAFRAFVGRLEPDRDFALARLPAAEISSRRHRLRLALDGESLVMRPPLRYRIRPRALRMIVPEPA